MKRNKLLLLMIVLVLMSSCVQHTGNETVENNSYSDVLTGFFESVTFYTIKNAVTATNTDTVYFLENEFISDSINYKWKDFSDPVAKKNVLVKPREHFLKDLSYNYLYIQEIIKNEDLARIDITYKESIGIQVSLEKNKEGLWRISHYTIKDNLRLKNQGGTILYREINRQMKLKDRG